MKDRVSLYPGRVKLTPVSGQANTYDMVRADEPTQEGDPLSKATFLKDATAALFGLDATAVPDDALSLLSRFHKGLGNEYVWRRCIIENNFLYTTTDYSGTRNFAIPGATMYYSDEFTYDPETENFTLVNPVSFYWAGVGSAATDANVLLGKYVIKNTTNVFAEMQKIDASATFTKGSDNVLQVSAFIGYSNPHIETTVSDISYLNSPDPNAYPPAVPDGYTYTLLGQIGEKVQIKAGSYTGTGTAGSGNPNTLTFEFVPKFLIVGSSNGFFISSGNVIDSFIWFSGVTIAKVYNTDNCFTLTNTTLSWYNSGNSAGHQCNGSGRTYYYVAIG